MVNGQLIKGRFHSFDTLNRQNTKVLDIALQNARVVQNKKDEGKGGVPMIIQGLEYNYIMAKGVHLGNGGSRDPKFSAANVSGSSSAETSTSTGKRQGAAKFKTDAEISKSKGQRQDDKLVEWKSEGPVDESKLCSLDNESKTEWDQFESNRKKFGLETTYDENVYTTELNLSEVSQKVQDQAAKIASEIMGPHGQGGYSQLETYLEQDDDTGENPEAETVVKKTLARSMREQKREEKGAPTPKSKSRGDAAGSKSESKQKSHAADEKRSEHTPDNDKKADKPASKDRTEEKSTSKHAGHDTKPTTPASSTPIQAPPKKSFEFNPNASSFTPISSIQGSIHMGAAVPSSVATHVPPKMASESPTANDVPSSQKIKDNAPISSQANSKFYAFSPMMEYPKLDVSSYTNRNWPHADQYFDEMWPNCSEISYRNLLGDMSMMHHMAGVMAMRPQHAIIPSAGMAAVILPQGTPMAYPAYHIGGIPLNMLPYGRQMTPKFYTSPRQSHQAMQPLPTTRRPYNMVNQPPTKAKADRNTNASNAS
eukprot:XP_001612009.1 ataxin-2 N-terminal region domain containing protein [Babesia bovis T2Bo]